MNALSLIVVSAVVVVLSLAAGQAGLPPVAVAVGLSFLGALVLRAESR